jgi:hypothetical protein
MRARDGGKNNLHPPIYSTNVGAVRNEIPQAPAIDHIFLSSLAMVSARGKSGTGPSKTHLFQSPHSKNYERVESIQ